MLFVLVFGGHSPSFAAGRQVRELCHELAARFVGELEESAFVSWNPVVGLVRPLPDSRPGLYGLHGRCAHCASYHSTTDSFVALERFASPHQYGENQCRVT
jgi:hypothetical protein